MNSELSNDSLQTTGPPMTTLSTDTTLSREDSPNKWLKKDSVELRSHSHQPPASATLQSASISQTLSNFPPENRRDRANELLKRVQEIEARVVGDHTLDDSTDSSLLLDSSRLSEPGEESPALHHHGENHKIPITKSPIPIPATTAADHSTTSEIQGSLCFICISCGRNDTTSFFSAKITRHPSRFLILRRLLALCQHIR